MNWRIFFFLFLFSCGSIYAQRAKLDSLFERVIDADEKNKMDLYTSIAKEYMDFRLDSALHFQMLSYFIAKDLKDKNQLALSLNSLGEIYLAKHEFVKSLYYFNQAYAVGEVISSPRVMAISLNNIASLYSEWGEVKKALENYEKALNLFLQHGKAIDKAVAYNNISSVYITMGELDKAKKNLQLGLSFAQQVGLIDQQADLYINLGVCYDTEDRVEQALINYQKALSLYKEANNYAGISTALLKLASVWIHQGQFAKAYSSALEVDEYAVFPMQRAEQLYLYSVIADSLKDYKMALYNFKRYTFQKDSIFKKEKFEILSRLQAMYGSEVSKKKNIELEAIIEQTQLSNKHQRKIIVFIAISLVIIIGLLVKNFMQYRLNLDQNKKLQTQNIKISEQNRKANEQSHIIEEQRKKLENIILKKEEIEEFRKKLSGMLIHDLKSPLNAIIGISELELETDNLHAENYRLIFRSGHKLLQLVNNILDIEKMNEAELLLNPEPIHTEELFDVVQEQMNFAIREKNIDFQVDIQKNVPLFGDRILLERMLINLVSNAIKYSDINTKITVRAFKNSATDVRLEVQDQGEGIAPEDLPFVFDRFTFFSKHKQNQKTSTGLGLAFCKMATEIHGGEIGVTSEIDKGALFWIILPIGE